MNSRVLILILLVLSFGSLKAQKVHLGFRIEANLFKIDSEDDYRHLSSSQPDAIQFNASYFPIKEFAFEARAGVEPFLENYIGYDFGLLIKYFITEQSPKTYLLCGIMLHHNVGDAHGTFTIFNKTFTMPAIGIGINPEGAFNLEALFQFGMKHDMAYSYAFRSDKWTELQSKLDWVLKFGAGFSWGL